MRKLNVLPLLLALISTPFIAEAAPLCPSPVPGCTTSGNLSVLAGQYGCTSVEAKGDNTTHVTLIFLTITGAGTATALTATNSNQSGTTTTFTDFPQTPVTLNYCVNSDNSTGYLTPPGSCPIAFTLSSVSAGVAGKIRGISSRENDADTLVCQSY